MPKLSKPVYSTSETAVRKRAQRAGFHILKTTSGGYRVLNIHDGKSPYQRGYQHPRSLAEISHTIELFNGLRRAVKN